MLSNYFRNTCLHWGELIIFIVISSLSFCIVPCCAIELIISFSVVYFLVALLYSSIQGAHKLGQWTLLSVAGIMGIGITLNVWYFTTLSGGTISQPVLLNEDSYRYFTCALQMLNSQPITVNVPYCGYPYLISLLWHITGVSVVVPLVINYLFTLLAIIMCQPIAMRVLAGKIDKEKLPLAGVISMFLTAVCCYYVGSGMVILKDPSIFLGVSLVAFVLAGVANYKELTKEELVKEMIIMILGTLILAFNRLPFVYIMSLGMLIFAGKKSIKRVAVFSVIIFIVIAVGYQYSSHTPETAVDVIQGVGIEETQYMPDRHDGYNQIIAGYFDFPAWKRTLMLPFTASVQYFIPFPWNFSGDVCFGISQIYSHIAYPWYCVGGIIFFFFFLRLNFRENIVLWRWVLFAMITYLIPAYLFAGSVSRYWLPFLPIYTLIGSYVIMRLRDGAKRKAFAMWSVCYILVVVAVLLVCYRIMNQ